jgi:hypothetical protein
MRTQGNPPAFPKQAQESHGHGKPAAAEEDIADWLLLCQGQVCAFHWQLTRCSCSELN